MATKASGDLTHSVTLLWRIMPNNGKWNEICAWAVERFGLPGDRYRTEISTEHMTWYFNDIRDKIIFTVAWGNHEL